ncbi:uncharacterized protein LOC130748677 [Lotus japonicus]|uniref:uncharacterized protein LOC130748677 n=1 Tax=Lotus japonicus TaxID=34305 RepID=UPI00258ACDD7|nr:uncharacterized protein LOC130748677 [Lotus japonicus]
MTFQSLKENLSKPPILSKPVPGISLSIFISISDSAVSSVLLQELKDDLRIIYFVSHALQGAELRYQKIEKAALALIISARKLRPYFQGFPVVVKTDLPLRQVLQKPDLAGRMVSWVVELSEFGISFEKKGQVKTQTLIDFVNEMSPDEKSEELEYEAIIAGLRLAIEMGVQSIRIMTDSQIVSRQIQGEYQANDAQLAKYLVKAQNLMKQVAKVQINHVPREENTRADILSKLASTKKPGNNKSVIHEVLNSPSIENEEVMAIPMVIDQDWMGRIKLCLEAEGADLLLFTKDQIREASHYTLLGDQLYRRGVGVPLLRCVSKEEDGIIMFEVHEGVCASHVGGRSLAAKVLRAGFYWPTLRSDCMECAKKCVKCQMYADLHRAPPETLSSMSSSWPFAMWGVDILGPFSPAEMGIEMRFASVEHPQSNGQVESANKVILNGVKKCLAEAKGLWVDELIIVIWAYNTTPQSTTGETPFKLTYGVDAMIPVEVQDVTFRVSTYNEEHNDMNRLVDLNLADETQAEVRLRQAVVKQRSERRYNTRVVPRQMEAGDLVLRSKTRGPDDSKLSPNWEGPYRIRRELGQGAYHLEELSGRRIPRAWNAQHLRYYYN